jgi:hypothetical protein
MTGSFFWIGQSVLLIAASVLLGFRLLRLVIHRFPLNALSRASVSSS